MAYASRSGRARTSSSNPQAFAVCNRCGIWYNRVDLANQMRWRGTALLPTWIFVCRRCYDIPNEQERVFVPPADPVPIILPFPEDFSVSDDVMGPAGPRPIDPTTGLPAAPLTTAMATTDGVEMGPSPTGRPNGYYALGGVPNWQPVSTVFMCEADRSTEMVTTAGDFMTLVPSPTGEGAPGPEVGWMGVNNDGVRVRYGVPLPILSMMADGTPLVRVTCALPHGLALNDQIGVRGTKNPLADGLFSVIPLTATLFTYGCYSAIPPGPLLEADTIVVTALAGLPRQYAALPQTGP